MTFYSTGRFTSDKSELNGWWTPPVSRYYQSLAVQWLTGRQGAEFWSYHRERLAELGFPLTRAVLLKAAVADVIRNGANPGLALGKLRRRLAVRAL